MDNRIPFLVIGVIVGVGLTFFMMNTQITDLRVSLSSAQMQYLTISNQYQQLEAQKADLQNQYNQLSASKASLDASYTQLQSQYEEEVAKAATASGFYKSLSQKITTLEEDLRSYCFLTNSFSRVLNDEEVKNIGSTVAMILSNEPNYWAAYDKINTYVIGHIGMESDSPSPYIQTATSQFDGATVVSGFTLNQENCYIKTPLTTLTQKTGNTESQTILTYAMMKYYDRYMNDVVHTTYYGVVSFSDGSTHNAIFCPDTGQKILIFDPSADYVTRFNGVTTSKLAVSELGSYYNYWESQDLLITSITFYQINTVNGSYNQVFKGTLTETINFFSS